MDEYPKVIDVDGIKVTAWDADDEARWRQKPANPLNDVVIEMDAPADDAPVYDIQSDEVVPESEPVSEPEPKKKKAPKKK